MSLNWSQIDRSWKLGKKSQQQGCEVWNGLMGGGGGRNPEDFSLGGLEAARTWSRAMDLRPPVSTAVTAWTANTWAGHTASPSAGAGGVGWHPSNAGWGWRPREVAACPRRMSLVRRRCGCNQTLPRHKGLEQEGRAAHAEPIPPWDPTQDGEGKGFPTWLDLATTPSEHSAHRGSSGFPDRGGIGSKELAAVTGVR